jgi:hypothetical protein
MPLSASWRRDVALIEYLGSLAQRHAIGERASNAQLERLEPFHSRCCTACRTER